MGKIKIGLIILGSIALVGLVAAGIVMAKPPLDVIGSDNSKAKFVKDEIVVKFKGDVKPFRVIKVPEGKVWEEIGKYKKRADVIYAEPNYIAYAQWVSNDPYYSYQWHLDNPDYGGIQMEKAWDISTGSPEVIVAVVDTGIAHEDYGRYCQAADLAKTCFVQGYDFVNNDQHPNDDNRHGTHVAGTIAQSTNNNLGVAGVAFDTCLMPVKVLNRRGSGTYADVASGIRFAVDNEAKVINLSLGGSASDETLRGAVQYAYENGVTVIAACGNDNVNSCLYPAAYDDYVIAVGATQYDEKKAPYSNYGPSLDLVAPGGNNDLDQNNDGYADGVLQQTFSSSWQVCDFAYYFFQGTSMATPHVSGVAALLLAKGNATNPNDIRTALQETAEDKGDPDRDDTYGYGLVDAAAALAWTAGPDTTVPTISIEKPADGSVTNSQEVSFVVKDNVDVDEATIAVTINGASSSIFDPAADCTAGTTEVPCSYTETGIVEGSNTLTVDAKDTAGNAATQAKTTFTYDVTPPAQVTGLTAKAVSSSQIDLSWNANTESDLDHYNVYRDTTSGGPYDLIASPTTNSYLDTGLKASTTYYYVVSAVDKAGNEGEKSTQASATTEKVTAVKCWNGSNTYLYRKADQAKKFCKCAQGTYGYQSYSYKRERATVYKYVDTGDNENWDVTSLSSRNPISSVTCTDSKAYPTNLDYTYPK